MGTQYILQPNGKWACYSTTIDRLEAIDLGEEEVIAIELEQAKTDTVERMQKYLADKKLGKRNQFFRRLGGSPDEYIEASAQKRSGRRRIHATDQGGIMQGKGRKVVTDRFIRFCRLLEPLLNEDHELSKGHCVNELHQLSQHWWDAVDRIYVDAETNGGG